MRTAYAASSLALSAVVLLSACSSSDPGVDDVDHASEALTVRGGGSPPPPPKKKPTVTVPIGGAFEVLADPPACSPKQRFDLRRKTRACENLPGAVKQGDVWFIPGAGGKFRVGQLLAGTSAPPALQQKACIYTWEPDVCAAPDKAKLLVEATENLLLRPSVCVTNPAACSVATTIPATHGPSINPNGGGRCEVCGYAGNHSMWVVLPPDWNGFRYQLAGSQTLNYVFLPAPAVGETPASVVEVELGAGVNVAAQDLDLMQAFE